MSTVTVNRPMGISIPYVQGFQSLTPPSRAQNHNRAPAPHDHGAATNLQSSPPSTASNRKVVEGERVLASRFRTKLCANYIENGGWCPYESRCMFAHGEHELRTTEMNLRDGLVTEETIKAFKRFLHLRRMGIEVLPPSHAVHWADAAAPEPQRDLNVAGSKLHVAAAEDASPSASVSDSLWYRWCPYSTSNSVVYFRDHEDSSDRSSHQGHDLHDHRSNVEFDHTDESSSESSIPATPTLVGSGPNQFPQVGPFEGSSYEI